MTLKFRTESGSLYTIDRENDKIFVEPYGYKTTMEFDLVHCEPVTVGASARMTYLVGEYVHLIETSEVTEILTDTLGDLSGLTFGEPVQVEYSAEVQADIDFDKEFS